MSTVRERLPVGWRSAWPWLALALAALVLLLCSLTSGLLAAPIQAFDESRNVINAMEMHRTGLSLVTTYGYRPDLWNTKPPLLIWLMVLSVRLFGVHVWALRLPVLFAGLGTLALVSGFTWRLTRSGATTVLAALLLAGSQGFFTRHAVATADYDAMLTLLTTAYLCMLFWTLHRARPSLAALLGIGALIAAATLTKGIAGLIPGVGVLLYLLLTRRLSRPLRSWKYAVGTLAALLPVCLYYAAREAAASGYLSAVVRNELGGRYLHTIGLHVGPWYYYLALIAARRSLFVLGPLAFLTPLGLLLTRGRARLGLLYALCLQIGVFAVFSAGATKLDWYLVPAYPFMAIAVALTLSAALRRLAFSRLSRRLRAPLWPHAGTLVVIAVLGLVGERLVHTWVYFRQLPHPPFGQDYGALFAQMHRLGVDRFAVVDGGIENTEQLQYYNPQLRFYRMLWHDRVQVTEVVADLQQLPDQAGAVAASCDQRYLPRLARLGARATSVPFCLAVRLDPQQLARSATSGQAVLRRAAGRGVAHATPTAASLSRTPAAPRPTTDSH